MQAQQAEKETGKASETGENKRARVRRLVLEPLKREGFRFRHGTPEDKQAVTLTRMCDAIVYMSDDGLKALRVSLATKGEGGDRHFWPSYATIIGLAEAFEKRPLVEVPELFRWFRSVAGREALAGDRLVAEYQFWQAKKRPPVKDADARAVQRRADDLRDRAARAQEALDRGAQPYPGEGEWLAGYRRTQAYVEGLVVGNQASNQAGDTA